MSQKKKILIAPLHWGLGHATRCIPIIRALLTKNCEVQIASDGDALLLLKKEFPELKNWELPSYNINYGQHFVRSMAMSLPTILKAIRDEKIAVEKIVRSEKIAVLISDNRYGCYTADTKNIFICHQHHLLLPNWMRWLAPIVNATHNKLLGRFDEHWIPDDALHALSGKLSLSVQPSVKYIGALSRLSSQKRNQTYDLIAIVSGPDPQRSDFFEILKKQLIVWDRKSLLVGGKISENTEQHTQINQCTLVPFMNTEDINNAIESTPIVLCRSGYSSVMDIAALQKKVIFVPTPGQTEQEFLASKFEQEGIAFFQTQQAFNLQTAISNSTDYKGFVNFTQDCSLLEKTLNSII